jgi:N6-L-threonylcarbamoyladenine synthase
MYKFSHQRGHIYAALYSSGKRELYGKKFIAFHVSGGTTEALLVDGDKIELIGGTKDLTAGQLIDRTGVYMDLSFPCGKEIEKLSKKAKAPKVKISAEGTYCNMSGAENKVKQMLEKNLPPEEIAAYVIEFVRANLEAITKAVIAQYGDLPLVFSGGVMSCGSIKKYFEDNYGAYFASPEFSSDNGGGIALLGELEYNKDGGR